MIFEIMLSFLCLLYDANVQYIPAHTVNSCEIKTLIHTSWKMEFHGLWWYLFGSEWIQCGLFLFMTQGIMQENFLVTRLAQTATVWI